MKSIYFKLENEWLKRARKYIVTYNYYNFDIEPPLTFSKFVRKALHNTLLDLTFKKSVEKDGRLTSKGYKVCRANLSDEEYEWVIGFVKYHNFMDYEITPSMCLRASVKVFLESTKM